MQPRLTPIVVQAPQRSDDWFKARLGNVTASMVSVTMSYYAVKPTHLTKAIEWYSLNKDLYGDEWIQTMIENYPAEFCLTAHVDIAEKADRESYRREIVTERITGMPGDLDPYISKDMIWGQSLEPLARSQYQAIYGHSVQEAPLMLHPTLMCGASPDGLVIDLETGELGNLEIKCLKSKNHLYKVILEDKVPVEYKDQIQMQMWISDRDWCDFVAYDSRVKEGLRLYVKRIERDDFFIDNVLKPSVERFLEEADAEERKFYAIMNKRGEEARQRLLATITKD